MATLARDNIQEKVEALLRDGKVVRAPVPVERIALNLGIEVKYAAAEQDLSGALIRSAGNIVIGVNSSHHLHRQRFTIAHELGHFLLHKGIQMHVDDDFVVNLRDAESSKATSWEEIEANRFAAELLMPADFMEKDVERRRLVDKTLVGTLAKKYLVSPWAMELRLVNLGYISPM